MSTHERVPCQVNAHPIPGLGFLSQTSDQDPNPDEEPDPRGPPLPPDAKLEIPLWMATALVRRARLANAITVHLPEVYTHECRSRGLLADPEVLDLPKIAPFRFYHTGNHMLRFAAAKDPADLPEYEALGKVLVDVLKRRFRYILDASFNADSTEAPSKMNKLDKLERDLYVEGGRSQKRLRDWFHRKTDVIDAADMVVRHRKRKADALN